MKVPVNPQVRSQDILANTKPLVQRMRQPSTLRASVSAALNDYLGLVDADMVNDLYGLVLAEVEAPLLEAVMQKARSNQSKAAQMLGVSRGTLRTMLKKYKMLD
jgi:Fis family transcriptional regulator, factor for inversion stimulation protein